MRKTLIVAAAAIVLVGGSALTYQAYARSDGQGRHHSRMNADDMNAYAAARIAALRAGLRLSAEQEKLWPPVESVLRELADKRIERREAFRAERRDRRERWGRGAQRERTERQDRDDDDDRAEREDRAERPDRDDNDRADRGERQRPDPIERLRRGGERLSETGADLTRLADATEPLYRSLDDAQKRRFTRLARDGMRGARNRHKRREWRRHGDAGRHMNPRRYERDHERRYERDRTPGGRDRMEWREDAPRGAERL